MAKLKRLAAQYTLYEVMFRVLQLMAPVVPHLTEELYQAMYAETKGYKSIQLSSWPKYNAALVNETSEKDGDLIIAIIGEIRREKAEKKLALNAPIKKLVIYAGDQASVDVIKAGSVDISGTCKIVNLEVCAEKGTGRELAQFPNVHIVTEY